MSTAYERGKIGEQYTADTLKKGGWQILERNYRVKGGEIDIIAEKDDTLIFVEVKTRKPHSLVSGEEAVTKRKQRFIIRTAERYLYEHGIENRYIRFDVAALTVTEAAIPRVIDFRYYENAFDATDAGVDVY